MYIVHRTYSRATTGWYNMTTTTMVANLAQQHVAIIGFIRKYFWECAESYAVTIVKLMKKMQIVEKYVCVSRCNGRHRF